MASGRSSWRSRPHQISVSVASSAASERPASGSPRRARVTVIPFAASEVLAERPVDVVGIDRLGRGPLAPDPDANRRGGEWAVDWSSESRDAGEGRKLDERSPVHEGRRGSARGESERAWRSAEGGIDGGLGRVDPSAALGGVEHPGRWRIVCVGPNRSKGGRADRSRWVGRRAARLTHRDGSHAVSAGSSCPGCCRRARARRSARRAGR